MAEHSVKKRIMLIDAMNLIHRSYYAYPRLTAKTGEHTGALFGFVQYLKSLQKKYSPDHMIICSDTSRKSFRTDIYPAYKGTRTETDAELISQFAYMETYLEKCSATFIKLENYEADDLIGTLAVQAAERGYAPYIVSGDRDLFQMVTHEIKQIYLSTKEGMVEVGPEEVVQKYDGLAPEQMIDLKALMGDASDNIPGIRGVGEKTAIKLLTQFGTLEGIYKNTDQLKGKLKEKVENGKADAYLSKWLATIDREVDLDLDVLLEPHPHFSLCTKDAYDFLNMLGITRIYKQEDIYQVPEPVVSECGLDLPFEVVETTTGDLSFRCIDKYQGEVSKEGLGMYVYSLLLETKNRKPLISMLKKAEEDLLQSSVLNEDEIEKLKAGHHALVSFLKNDC